MANQPFHYDPYQSPYTGSLVDLMLRGGQVQAQAAQQVGEAQARAAEQRGQAWGQAAQNIGQTIGAIPQQIQQQRDLETRRQLTQAQLEQHKTQTAMLQREQAFKTAADHIVSQFSTVSQDGATRADLPKIQAAMAAQGIPSEIQKQTIDLIGDVNGQVDKWNELKTQHRADFAHSILSNLSKYGDLIKDPATFAGIIGIAKENGMVNDAEIAPITQAIASGADPIAILHATRSMSEKYKDIGKPIVIPQGGTLANTDSGAVIASGTPKPPTEAELALQAAGGNPAGAMQLLKPAPVRSLDEQMLEAIAAGDKTKQAQIHQALQADAAAKRDPVAMANAAALNGLSQELARTRLEALRDENKPVDLSANTTTTASGRAYVDLSSWQTPKAKERAKEAADAAGITALNKDQADGLRAADTARANLQGMLSQIKGKLPTSPDGRLLLGPANKISQYVQSDSDLAAWGAWRTAAIQAVQALAEKGMGLRLNRAEIDLMLQNDIPQITDTWDVAQKRVGNLMQLLDNKEGAILNKNRAQGAAPSLPTGLPTGAKIQRGQ